jgi:hypothetical protein
MNKALASLKAGCAYPKELGMKRYAWIMALSSLLTMLAFTAPASAAVRPSSLAAPSVDPFNIHNYKAAGKCIGIAPGQYYAGLWNCVNHPDQQWRWSSPSYGAFRHLVNNNNKCLGIAGGSGAEGARLVAWSCNPNPSDQDWVMLQSPVTGEYYLYSAASIYVIGVAGGSTANGARLVMWQQLSHPDQYWH